MLEDVRALVADKLRDTADKISASQRDTAIAEAVADYSRWRPQVLLHEVTGDGSAYSFALPTTFEVGWSVVQAVEHPVDAQTPTYLDGSEYALYRQVAGSTVIRFPDLVIETGERAYVSYTARHTLDAVADTIPLGHRDLIASKATAICFRQLAAYYAQTSEPTLGADVVNYRSKSQEYLMLAKALEATYDIALGLGADSTIQAASAIGDLDVEMQELGGPRFWHGNRWR